MTTDLLARVRAALTDHAERLDGFGSGAASSVRDLLDALPPEPGGAMPEPLPNYVATVTDGSLCARIDAVTAFLDGQPGAYLARLHDAVRWTPEHIREVRAPDGRVLWTRPA
jgi:hypothetical protein